MRVSFAPPKILKVGVDPLCKIERIIDDGLQLRSFVGETRLQVWIFWKPIKSLFPNCQCLLVLIHFPISITQRDVYADMVGPLWLGALDFEGLFQICDAEIGAI